MFPRAFDETKNAGVNHKGLGRIFVRKIIFLHVVSAISLKLRRSVTLNGCNGKICYYFVRHDQVKGMARNVKFRRILLEMPALWEKFGQDLSLILHQSR